MSLTSSQGLSSRARFAKRLKDVFINFFKLLLAITVFVKVLHFGGILGCLALRSGAVLSRASGVHEHFINISSLESTASLSGLCQGRFCNTCPHIFATALPTRSNSYSEPAVSVCQASFDHSCKIWDLRRPLRSPVKMLRTDGHNVMCTFSPDDRRS